MVQTTLRLLVVVTALLSATMNVKAFEVLAYYFVDESYPRMVATVKNLTQVSFDQFGIDNRGNVHGSISPSAALPFAKSHGLQNFLCVSNYGPDDFNGPRVHQVLKSAMKRNRLINKLVQLVKAQGADGINIDFEAIPRGDRNRYTMFIQNLAKKLHANAKKLVISVPALDSDQPQDDWGGAFDYAKLGAAADIMQIMTYDENGPWGSPGPVAGLDWVMDCINYAKSVIDPQKISMGIPAYAYEWNKNNGNGFEVDWNTIEDKLSGATIKWDAASSSPYATYTKNGAPFVMWYENAQSLKAKMDFARASNILGVSVWALNADDDTFWKYLLA